MAVGSCILILIRRGIRILGSSSSSIVRRIGCSRGSLFASFAALAFSS